jgi:hypothetical protein
MQNSQHKVLRNVRTVKKNHRRKVDLPLAIEEENINSSSVGIEVYMFVVQNEGSISVVFFALSGRNIRTS